MLGTISKQFIPSRYAEHCLQHCYQGSTIYRISAKKLPCVFSNFHPDFVQRSSRTFMKTVQFSMCSKFPGVLYDLSQMKGNVSEEDNNNVTPETFEHLADTEELKKHLKHIITEYNYFKYTGSSVPSQLSSDDVKELMTKSSRTQRAKYLNYLRKIELKTLSTLRKKELRKAVKDSQRKEKQDIDMNEYGLWKNTMFIRLSETFINRYYLWRQANAMMYGQSIVIDFGFDEVMNKHECVNAADQILRCYGFNKVNMDPFHLHFCNAGESNFIREKVNTPFPNKDGLVNITEKSYLDIFPKEKLVYLTPDAQNTLDDYDPDAIYIIGALVDKSVTKPLTLAKAKAEGIKMAKLPIDKYIAWKKGVKTLTIDQVFCIMLEAKNTQNWSQAFQFVPRRKIIGYKMAIEERLNHTSKRRGVRRSSLFVDMFEK